MSEPDAPAMATVLIVDDNARNLQVLANILRDRDFRVATARNGEMALRFLSRGKPDLILLDIMMPGMDGYALCRRIQEDPETADIPVLFISALTETEDKLRGFAAGGRDYITKPFQREEVHARVSVHLRLKQAQESLKSVNDQLGRANAAKDKLLSIISHDLRGPIGGLRNSLESMAANPERFAPDTRRRMMEDLLKSVDGAYEMLEKLLCWANSQRGRIQCSPEGVPVEYALNHCLRWIGASAAEKSIRTLSEVSPGLTVFADAQMLMTILRNLLANAVKFTPEGGQIRASAAEGPEGVIFQVADTGVGIGPERLTKLFDIEHHFTTAGTRNERGSGLGLLLCAEFAARNAGHIRAESVEGAGSVFTLILPRPAAAAGTGADSK